MQDAAGGLDGKNWHVHPNTLSQAPPPPSSRLASDVLFWRGFSAKPIISSTKWRFFHLHSHSDPNAQPGERTTCCGAGVQPLRAVQPVVVRTEP